MTNEEKFRKALRRARYDQPQTINLSEVLDVCKIVSSNDLLVFIEDDSFIPLKYEHVATNIAIDKATFSIIDIIRMKLTLAIMDYKEKNGIPIIAIFADGFIHIEATSKHFTRITIILKVKPI